MDWQTIILAVIGSGVATAIVNAWAARTQSRAAAHQLHAQAELTEAEIADKVAAVYERTIKHLTERVAALESVQSRLESTEAELTTRVRENIELRQKVQHLSAENAALRDQVAALTKQLEDLRARVKQLEKRGTEPLKG